MRIPFDGKGEMTLSFYLLASLLALFSDVGHSQYCKADPGCRAGSGMAIPCKDVLIVMDATQYMDNDSFIETQFNFVTDKLLPAYDLRGGVYGVAMAMYGFHDWGEVNLPGPLLIFFTRSDINEICSDITCMRDFIHNNHTRGVTNLETMLEWVVFYANSNGNRFSTIVLFTAATDQKEVDHGGEYYRDVMGRTGSSYDVVIIGVNNPQVNFNAWGGDAKIYRTGNFNDMDGAEWGECIATTGCDFDCHIQFTTPNVRNYSDHYFTPGPSAAPLPTKSLPPTTTLQTTLQPTTTTTTPLPFTVPPPTRSPVGCGCNFPTLWLDIMFVVDSSSAMTKSGLDTLSNFILTALGKATVGQASDARVSRVGFITFADDAELIFGLQDFKSVDDLYDRMFLPFYNRTGSNIFSGMDIAIKHFANGTNHRSNCRKVIVLAASSYTPDQYNNPVKIANQFKGDGGIVITLEYVQTHGTPVPFLALLASPNYNLTNINGDLYAADMLNLFCYANCFCKRNYNPYEYATGRYGTPDGGCYDPISLPSNEMLAERFCKRSIQGSLPIVEDVQKALFIDGNYQTKEDIWIGLKSDGNGGFNWSDGTQLGSYHPWGSGEPNLSNGKCVFQNRPSGFNVKWWVDDCADDKLYICQSAPCDSLHYCDSK